MKVSSLVHVIQTLVIDSGQTSERHIAHAAEELGEVAKAARAVRDAQRGQAHVKLKEAQVEAVDLAICALALYASFGGCAEEFEHMFARKCSKWKTALEGRSMTDQETPTPVAVPCSSRKHPPEERVSEEHKEEL